MLAATAARNLRRAKRMSWNGAVEPMSQPWECMAGLMSSCGVPFAASAAASAAPWIFSA